MGTYLTMDIFTKKNFTEKKGEDNKVLFVGFCATTTIYNLASKTITKVKNIKTKKDKKNVLLRNDDPLWYSHYCPLKKESKKNDNSQTSPVNWYDNLEIYFTCPNCHFFNSKNKKSVRRHFELEHEFYWWSKKFAEDYGSWGYTCPYCPKFKTPYRKNVSRHFWRQHYDIWKNKENQEA